MSLNGRPNSFHWPYEVLHGLFYSIGICPAVGVADQYTAFQKIYNIFLEERGIIPHFLNYKFIELRDKINARSAYFMKLKENTYTFVFALIVCVVCSFLLALVSEGLKPKKEINIALDIKKNILKAVDLREPLGPKAVTEEILEIYDKKIEEYVIDAQGNEVEGKKATEVERQLKEIKNVALFGQDSDALYPVYIYKEGDQTMAYCFPIIGKGLWSTLYGYFALEADAITVRGITFYQHGETPGLGAEIEQDWFQNNYKGKTIWDVKNMELVPIVVVKGKVADKIPEEQAQYYVDGISGATMTSKGVTEMVGRWLNIYEPFFKKVRK